MIAEFSQSTRTADAVPLGPLPSVDSPAASVEQMIDADKPRAEVASRVCR